MKLMTKALEKRFAKVGRQEYLEDPIIVAHYFNPCGPGDWYAYEYNPEYREFFGYVSIFRDWNDELGYFSLTELEQQRCPPFGLKIERDLYWTEKPLSEVKKSLYGGKDAP